MLVVGSAFKGYAIEASDGGIGTVSDLLFDDRTWQVRWLVVDTGKWLPGRAVLIHPSSIGEPDHAGEKLPVALTKEQVKDSPDIFQDRPVSQQMESNLYDHYGWDPLWGGGYFGAGAMAAPPVPMPYLGGAVPREAGIVESRLNDGDPHLRSIAAVQGYHIHATDGDIGHVENFLVNEARWGIRYLIIDTKNWWPGKRVLISPYAVREINWSDRHIELDVSRDQVKTSPPWDPLDMIDQIYEERLHRHYEWPGYGW